MKNHMTKSQQIHQEIDHDCKESCSMVELIDKVLKVNQHLEDKEVSDFYFDLALKSTGRSEGMGQ